MNRDDFHRCIDAIIPANQPASRAAAKSEVNCCFEFFTWDAVMEAVGSEVGPEVALLALACQRGLMWWK